MTTERTEYRLVGRANSGPYAGELYEGSPRTKLVTVEREAYEAKRRGNTEVRIETRTVVESPWTDLPEEGER